MKTDKKISIIISFLIIILVYQHWRMYDMKRAIDYAYDHIDFLNQLDKKYPSSTSDNYNPGSL